MKITQIQTICGTNHEIMKFGNGRMISFLINHENHLLLEADSSALFIANEAPVPAAAKSIALPLTMRAGMNAASGRIPPFCLLRFLFFALHLFRSAFLPRAISLLGKMISVWGMCESFIGKM